MTLDGKNRTLKACILTATLLLAGAGVVAPTGTSEIPLVETDCLVNHQLLDVCYTADGPGTPLEEVPVDVDPTLEEEVFVVGSVRLTDSGNQNRPALGFGQQSQCESWIPFAAFFTCAETELLPTVRVREVDPNVETASLCLTTGRLGIWINGEEEFSQENVPGVQIC